MFHRTYRTCLILAISVLLGVVAGSSVWAQGRAGDVEVEFEGVDAASFPIVTTWITVLDPDGVPIAGLEGSKFVLREDGQEIPIIQAEPFVNPDVRIAVVLAIDTSGSMLDAIGEAKEAAKTFVSGLGANDMVAVIGFQGDPGDVDLSGSPFPQINPEREINFTEDKAQVQTLIDGLKVSSPNARTPLYDALFKGARMASEVTGVDYKFVIAFTDGNEKCRGCGGSIMKEDDPIDEATKNRIPVFTIGLGADADEDYMQRVALMTSGDYKSAPTPDMLAGIYQGVADQVKQQYKLTYEAQAPADGQEHELELRASTPKGEGVNSTTILYTCAEKPTVDLHYMETGDASGQETPMQSGVQVEGKITIVPKFVNCSPISKVELLLDGQLEGTAEEAPFHLIYDFSALRETMPGLHQLTVRAQDLVGNVSEDVSVDVEVLPMPTPTPPPTATVAPTVVPPPPGPIATPTPSACTVNVGSRGVPCWVFAVLGGLVFLGLLAILLFVTQRKKRCPTCGRVMDPGWTECLFCAQQRTTLTDDTARDGIPTVAGPGLPDQTAPEISAVQLSPQPYSSQGYQAPQAPPTEMIRQAPRRLGWLIVEQGGRVGQEYQLQPGDTNIGRGGTNDIPLSDSTVSRQQARVRQGPKGYDVYDLAATNPTLVNGKPITRHRLREGDRIQVGNVVLVYKEIQTE